MRSDQRIISESLIDKAEPVSETARAGLGRLTPAARYCVDLFEEYSDSQYRQDKLTEVERGRKLYKQSKAHIGERWEGSSRLTLGLILIAVDHIEPRLYSKLCADEDFVEVSPVGSEDEAHVRHVQEFMSWCTRQNMKMGKAFRPMIHDLCLDGTVDVIPVWRERRVIRKTRAFMPDGMGGVVEHVIPREHVEFRVSLEQVPLHDAFFPDTGKWEEEPYLRYIYPTLEELQDLTEDKGGPYFDIDESLLVDPGRMGADNESEATQDKGVRHSEHTRRVKLLECHVPYMGQWLLITLAPDSGFREVRYQVLEDVYPDGKKPVFRFRLRPESDESMGTGIPKLVSDLHFGADELYNLMIDSGTVDVTFSGFMEYQGLGGGGRDSQARLIPGEFADLPAQTIPHFAPKSGIQAVQLISFLQIIMGFFERLTAIMDATLPGNPGGSRSGDRGTGTYSGMALISAEADEAHNYRAACIRETAEELLQSCFYLYAWLIPPTAAIRIFQNNDWLFKPVDMAALNGMYDFSISISDAGSNKMLARREAGERFTALTQSPAANHPKLVDDFLRAYGIKDTSEYINPHFMFAMQALAQHPEVVQVIQQFLQQKQQQAKQQELMQQAQANIARRRAQDQVEDQSGFEDEKLMDQLVESAKKSRMKPAVDAAFGVPQGGGG